MPSAAFRIEAGDATRDREEVIALAERNLSPGADREGRFRRYFEQPPGGAPLFWVARESTNDRVIGMFAVFPVRVRVDGRPALAGIQGDYAVDREFRGAFGPAVPLVRAVNAGIESAGLEFVYGAPNGYSRPVVSRLSCTTVGPIHLYAKPLRLDVALERLDRGPRAARTAARWLSPALRVVFRDDRHRFRGGGLRVEVAPTFDGRFADLWDETTPARGVIVERTVDYMNWKYRREPGSTDTAFSILCAVGQDERVAGYAVVTASAWGLSVADVVCRPGRRELDTLIGGLVAHARRSGAGAIGLRYCGPDSELTRRLRSFGFVRRTDDAVLMARPCGRLPAGVDVLDPDRWYFVGGDSDI